ncbi:hypothetical protein AAFF_G00235450 [Aldrovandia affinis]|uniref:Uncharacterized protein n=1 Tax=Aldrovandia affinis TaxID=143900 RepID=A0AAD7WU52_9TELE|nr:hypothetical protein AAFF_G00235450 [Aldrovandia affinis]
MVRKDWETLKQFMLPAPHPSAPPQKFGHQETRLPQTLGWRARPPFTSSSVLRSGAAASDEGADPEMMTGVAHRENWEELVMSPWVLSTTLKGYKLQFRCRAPSFRGIQVTTMGDPLKKDVLRLEISSFLERNVIREVEPSERLCGFYSTYFGSQGHQSLSEGPEVQDVGSCTGVTFEFRVVPFDLHQNAWMQSCHR